MIIAKIHGGLGNQLFQYAFGRNLAVKNNCELKLDLSFFDNQSLRKYALTHFSIVENIASAGECHELMQKRFSVADRFTRRFFKSRASVAEEKKLVFDPQFLKTGDNTYLNGYWQSEKYFSGISKQIKQELEIKTAPSAANSHMRTAIESGNAVSLHIRRGDFELDATVNKVHGTCSPDYYSQAAGLMAKTLADPVFYVFSDDMPWAREHLQLTYTTRFVDINNEDAAFEDLRLMHCCRHHILANSTFSWWGAWLNPKTDKIVIAPKTWFNDPGLNLQSASIIPETWIRI